MKQFDIEKYLENPKQRVVTRDGKFFFFHNFL